MMATEHRSSVTLGRGAAVLAFLTVQGVAFAAAYALSHPTWYAGFALLSAAVAGYLYGEGLFGVALAALGTVLLLAVGLPLALFVARQDPGLVAEAATEPAVLRSLYLGVYGPLLAALFGVGFGVPLAYLLARGVRGRAFVESLVDLPLVVPHSVAGLIVLYGFGTGGVLPQLRVLGTLWGMVLAMTFVSAPYAVNAAREAFEAVDPRLEYAARSHGASRFETFRRVTAPLAARGVLTGGVLAWARSVSEFGAVAIVAYNVHFAFPLPVVGSEQTAQHAPVMVYNTFLSQGLAKSGAVAFLLLALSAVIFLLVRWLAYGDRTTTLV